MKKILISIVVMLIFIVALAENHNGILWKVSGNGLPQPTYILGSHHLAPASFVDSVAGLRSAMDQASAVFGEVAEESLDGTSPEVQQKMLAYALAPADSTLSKVLSAPDLAMVDSLLAVFTGQHGLTGQMEMLKPSMVATQIALLQMMTAFPELQVSQPFDAVVMKLGKEMGKETGGLETIEQQLALLFGDPIAKQAADLMTTVRNNDKLMVQARDLTVSFLNQDLEAVTRISVDPEYGIGPEDLDRIIYNRNRAWAETLPGLMAQKPLLVVVGCGHLGGDQGLLALLREKGYNVEPVNK